MINGSLARRYSQALFDIASETALDPIDTDLRELTNMVEENQEIRDTLFHPHIPVEDKKSYHGQVNG